MTVKLSAGVVAGILLITGTSPAFADSASVPTDKWADLRPGGAAGEPLRPGGAAGYRAQKKFSMSSMFSDLFASKRTDTKVADASH